MSSSIPSIVVVGSCNLDVVVPVDHLPGPGETVRGADRLEFPGGKGANQAVAAARMGSSVAMVGAVGDDPAGRRLILSLLDAGIDVGGLEVLAGVPTGMALIAVDGAGENQIVLSIGANGRVDADTVAEADVVARAPVVMTQLEIGDEAVAEVIRRATGRVILTPAPVRPLSDEILAGIEVMVPNRVELGQLTGSATPTEIDDVAAAAEKLRAMGPATVVVTLGADGVMVVNDSGAHHYPTPEVDAIDTTGAGDTFCGALADGIARGLLFDRAVLQAVRAAALSTTRLGAQSAMPTANDLYVAFEEG